MSIAKTKPLDKPAEKQAENTALEDILLFTCFIRNKDGLYWNGKDFTPIAIGSVPEAYATEKEAMKGIESLIKRRKAIQADGLIAVRAELSVTVLE